MMIYTAGENDKEFRLLFCHVYGRREGGRGLRDCEIGKDIS
jgi:hypothetical protein